MPSVAAPLCAASNSKSVMSSILSAPAAWAADSVSLPAKKESPNKATSSTPLKKRKSSHDDTLSPGIASSEPPIRRPKYAPTALSPGKISAAVTGAGHHKKVLPTIIRIVGACNDSPRMGVKRRALTAHPSSCKRVKSMVAEVVHPHGQDTQPPPPPRPLEEPFILGVPPTCSNNNSSSGKNGNNSSRVAKAMKDIDMQVKSSNGSMNGSPSSGSVNSVSTPSKCTLSLRSSSQGSISPPTLRGRGSAAKEQPAPEPVPVVLTEVMEDAMDRISTRLLADDLAGMAQLLSFVAQAQVQCQEHLELFNMAMKKVNEAPALRKDFCDFEKVWSCVDVVYGRRPSAIFADLIDPRFPVVHTYHQHIFLRLFMHYAVTRLQLLRDMVMEKSGGPDVEEVGLVDTFLKFWLQRAPAYL